MQDRDSDKAGDVEPERDVHVTLATLDQRHQEVRPEEPEPYHRDRQVDGPLKLGILLALRDTQGERQRRRHDDQLPAPEVELAERVRPHPRLAQALGRVVHRREDRVAREGKDRRVRVQRAETTEGDLWQEVRLRESELHRQDHPDQERHDAPDQRRPEELPNDRVVVAEALKL